MYHNQHIEGSNELVFLNLQGARLGLLDLERFKRQINYCLLPNGTCTDMVLQVHGRYNDTLPFDFMAPMGIWFEAVFLYERDEAQLLSNFLQREPASGPQHKRARVSWLYSQWLQTEAERYGLVALPARPWDNLFERVLAAVR